MSLDPDHPSTLHIKYLFRVPATVQKKNHSERRYYPVRGTSYLYLGFDKRYRLQVHICINTNTSSTRIVISACNMLKIIKMILLLRPIRAPKKQVQWTYSQNLDEFLQHDVMDHDIPIQDLQNRLKSIASELDIFRACPQWARLADEQLKLVTDLQKRAELIANVKNLEISVNALKKEFGI